jgi:glycosyltransferase involved in cell wall biosynthesis
MTVGIVIRTLNESELIRECLRTLKCQRFGSDLDILVVDSGSTDGTVQIARECGARVVEMRSEEFDYSKALNLGIEQVAGDFAVSLSAHAIPAADDWLHKMIAPFASERVAAVASRQVPWESAPWQERYRLNDQFGDASAVYTRANPEELMFSNAASAIRRSVWEAFPFTLPAAEDFDWAQRVVAAGWAIVYESEARVYHSHHESARAQALRMIDLHRANDREEGERTRRRTVREAAGILRRDSRKIMGLDEPLGRKLAYLFELVRMVCYYVLDFTRSGTTAERRRTSSVVSPGGTRAPSASKRAIATGDDRR